MAVAWMTTICWLPRFYKKDPESKSALIERLFAGCAIVAVGGTFVLSNDKKNMELRRFDMFVSSLLVCVVLIVGQA